MPDVENTAVCSDVQPFFSGWRVLDPLNLPDSAHGPYLTTNFPLSRNAYGYPSHIWLVSMFHLTAAGIAGPIVAFSESDRRLWDLKLYRPVFEGNFRDA